MRIGTRKELGQLMREHRKGRGFTQAQLAVTVGASRRWVVQVENGKTSADLRTLLRAFRALGVEMHVRPRHESPAAFEIDAIVDSRRGDNA